MGYDAFVVCDCYKKGKIRKPPFEEYIKLDEDGLDIHPPDKASEYKMYSQFDKWRDNACEHDSMKFCWERLCNSSGMSNFRILFDKLGGKENYPILGKYLPVLNGGILPAEFAQDGLEELLSIQSRQVYAEEVLLVEKGSADVYANTTSIEHGILFAFFDNNRYNYALDKNGFFVIDNGYRDKRETFRSQHFTEIKITANKFKLIDKGSDKFFMSSKSLNCYPEQPKDNYEFIVKIEEVNISERIEYILETLKKLLNASITTGNPIHWC